VTVRAATVRPEPDPRERAPVSRLASWAAVLAGPVAFAVNHEAMYLLVPASCRAASEVPVHLSAGFAVLLVLGGMALARRNLRLTGGSGSAEAGGGESRTRFLALFALGSGVLFLAVIVSQWMPTLFLGPCLGAG
jgi:hypothetical protein